MDYRKLTDADLASLLKGQDRRAFTEIYRRYWQVMITHARAILKDENEAMDLVQDIFTVLWSRASELHIEIALKSYLHTSVRNQALKVITSGQRKEDFAEELANAFKGGVNYTDEQVNIHELEAILEKEVAKLPPRMQAIFRKSREEGLSRKDIAEEFGIAENSVKSSMRHTLAILREKIAPFLSLLIFFVK